MRVVRAKTRLPKDWSSHPKMIPHDGEFDIKLGSLRAKVIVFKTPKDLKKFWNTGLNRMQKLGSGRTLGAVTGLYCEVYPGKSEKPYLEVDPRYFCFIGLTRKNLSMECIAHESVHAAYCFVKRKSRTPWDIHAKSHDEEAIAYPAGRIAEAINRELYKRNLYRE